MLDMLDKTAWVAGAVSAVKVIRILSSLCGAGNLRRL